MPLVGEEIERIELPTAGEWVDVKKRLSKGDRVRYKQALARDAVVIPGRGIETVPAAIVFEANAFAMIEIVIRAWSFEEPITPEAIRSLDEESVDFLNAKLDHLYAERSDDDRKNSASAGRTQPSDEEASPPSSSD